MRNTKNDISIIIVSRGIPNTDSPMIGLFEYDQAKALAMAGVKVKIFAIDLRSIRRLRRFGITRGKRENVDWFSFSFPVGAVPFQIRSIVGRFAMQLLYKKAYRDKEKPDIIHAHFSEMGYISTKISEQNGIPLVITEHSSALNGDNINKTVLKYAIAAYSKADKCIAVSKRLAQSIAQKTGIQCSVVYNTVDLSLFEARKPIKHDGFRFITVGNLVDIKQHNLLIEAFCQVQEKYDNTCLAIVGGGPLYKDLEKQILKKQMSKKIKLYGLLPREKIAEMLSQSDCFVLPSKSETFGVACIEAMAAGIPVISTLCGGPEEYITEDVGMLVPNGDKNLLAAAMIKMIENNNRYSRLQIKEHVKNLFTPEKIAAQLIEHYKSVLKD